MCAKKDSNNTKLVFEPWQCLNKCPLNSGGVLKTSGWLLKRVKINLDLARMFKVLFSKPDTFPVGARVYWGKKPHCVLL